ncbi:MAG: molybdopterin molybdenumtransferase MoeA, partial [Gammaproteobacteria bacterium]|nr:molybdopterin molybdenumtransferase MoeA [Gammaproteobacteria bacterium]
MSNKITAATNCSSPVDPDSISVSAALEQIDRQITPVADFEELPIRECLGRICFGNVVSPINVPAHA